MREQVRPKRAIVIGTADTKQAELDYLIDRLRAEGLDTELLDATPMRWLDADDVPESRSAVMDTAAVRASRRK